MTCTQCTFCDIVNRAAPAYIVHETPLILAFLDILPARRGHLLIMPKQHFVLLSEVPNDLAREMGSALVTVSKALTQALGSNAFTVTLNQVYAQVVPHVHFHIVPALDLSHNSLSNKLTLYPPRQELDDEDAMMLVGAIKAKL